MLHHVTFMARSSDKVVSSTYLWTRQSSCRSSINRRNISGPSQEHCSLQVLLAAARGTETKRW